MKEYIKDVFRMKPHGKLYHFDPKTKKVQLIFKGLYFANGIVLEPS